MSRTIKYKQSFHDCVVVCDSSQGMSKHKCQLNRQREIPFKVFFS